jgi:peroxiredoxin
MARLIRVSALFAFASLLVAVTSTARAQSKPTDWTAQEKPISDQLDTLRSLPDGARVRAMHDLAARIRALPVTTNKVLLAYELASLSTEGDFGHDAVQEVTTNLADALRQHPLPPEKGEPAGPYIALAQLVRYENVQASLDDPQFAAALAKMSADDERRQHASFTLTDLNGKAWTFQALKGKVVLVNFWATWCPPCLKEIPDLEALYERFHGQGFVILAISDETEDKVKPFVAKHGMTYPVFLDPSRKVIDFFQIAGIPKSFVYDRTGKLVTESIDMRTQKQFLAMLAQAGLH